MEGARVGTACRFSGEGGGGRGRGGYCLQVQWGGWEWKGQGWVLPVGSVGWVGVELEGDRVGTACRFSGVGGSRRGRGGYCL